MALEKDVVLRDLTQPGEVKRLVDILRELYSLSGSVMIVTTDPNGSVKARKDTVLIYNNTGAGTYQLKVNTDGSTTWANA